MDTRRRRGGVKGKPAAGNVPEKVKPKHPIFRDMTAFARALRMPAGFSAASKSDVGRDIRSITGMPTPAMLDPERDPVLLPLGDRGPEWAEGHGLLPPAVLQYLRKHGPTPLPDTNARTTSLDEAPEVVSSLEAFLFRGAEPEEVWADAEEELNTLGLPAPARTMSGWFAARLAAESAGAGAGAAAMGPVRLDATLLERWLAILPTRRAETEARYLTLRRQYVAALKGYFMDAAEQGISLNALHAAAGAARAQVRPGSRPAAFATDEEEWAAVDKMSASSLAVARQNAQLRARLASATARVSGNLPGEAEARSAVAGAGAADAMQGIEQINAPAKVAGYGVRQRGAPRTGGPAAGAPVSSLGKGDGAEAVLACGDLVLSSYGRGVVVMQRDGARPSTPSSPALPSTTIVTLPYGTAYLSTPSLVLLAVAGEEYTAPASGDRAILAAVAELRTRGQGTPFEGPAASTAPLARADGLLYGVGPPAAASPKGGKGARGKGKAVPPPMATPPVYGAGASPATEGGDRAWERGAASRVASSLAEDGVVIDGRVPVFTTSWARNRIPRGVRLAVDPLGGSNTLGYVVGEGAAAGGAGAAVGQAGPGVAAAGATHIVVAATSADAAAQVRELFAETQRLRGQNRQAEESRAEQRKRLTDARLTIARLLEQLNSSRARETELGAELNRREKEVGDCEERIHELRAKYEPQALAADEAVAARAEGGAAASSAAKAMEALVASMSAEQGAGVDLAGLAGLTAAGASLPALKTGTAGGPASSPRAVPGVGTTSSGRKVAPSSAGGYRSSIMGQQLPHDEEEDSEKEEDKEGGEEAEEEEDDVATVQDPYDEEDEDGAAVAAALRGAGDDGDSMGEDQPVDAASGLMAALQADGGLEEVSGGAAEGAGLAFLEAGLASGLEGGGGASAAAVPAGRGGKGKVGAGTKRASTSSTRGGARGGKRPRKAMEEDGGEGGAGAGTVSGEGGATAPSQSDADTTMSLSQAESEAPPPAAVAAAEVGGVADKGAAGGPAARRGRSSVGRGRR